MNSSGIKRSLAVAATSALAVAGLPLLATSASAVPIEDQFASADDIAFYAPTVVGVSTKNDGTNSTVSLVVGGGGNVTSVLFQYSTLAAPATFVDVPGGLVSRNADGVFAVDWANPPADLANIQAVPNTDDGLGSETVTRAATNLGTGATVDTVELGSEGALGAFDSPYTEVGNDGVYVGATGTTSSAGVSVTVTDASAGTAGTDTVVSEDADGTAGGSGVFAAVLDIAGYTPAGGGDPDQIALNAATADTDDAEGSTLYSQTIGSITATPETQERSNPSNSEITLTVLDTQGQPVANAQVGIFDDQGTPATGDDTSNILGYTDGNGEFVDSTQTTADTFTYYVNTTDVDAFQAGTDPSDTATVTTYTPVISSVDVVNERNRANFDLDEFADSDDFTIATLDQRGNAIAEDLTGDDIEYRWVIDPSATGATVTSPWIGAETNGDGEFAVPGPTDANYATWSAGVATQLPAGSYTLEARRPSTTIGGQPVNATPETVQAGESEITFDEGANVNAPVNGEVTIDGTLALGSGAGLGGREIQLTYSRGNVTYNSSIAADADQPQGTDQTTPLTAVAVTDANGNFSVVLTDPDVPVNVTPTDENGNNLNAIAEESATDTTSLQGDVGPNDSTDADQPANAEADLTVNFIQQPDAATIDIDIDELNGTAAPGSPVDLDIVVDDADGNPLSDYPVTVEVSKGFLSPNAESYNDLTLADGQDDEGDLYGFFQNDGTEQEISTGDAGVAGVVAAIERDEDFDDDGLTEITITVTAGGVTETETVTYDVRNLLNLGDAELVRADGEPAGDVTVGDEVDFNLFVYDQFGNLAGDEFARISDDSTIADFRTDEDFDQTLSDFTTSGPGITAFSDAPAVQTLFAQLSPGEAVVDDNGDADFNNRNVTVTSEPINWVGVVEPPVEDCNGVAPTTLISGDDNGARRDIVRFVTEDCAAGDEVTLYKIRGKKPNKRLVEIRTTQVSEDGNLTFSVADRNGNKKTRFIAKVRDAADYGISRSNTQKLR